MSASVLLSTLNGIRAEHANLCSLSEDRFNRILDSASFVPEVSTYLRLLGTGAWEGHKRRNGLRKLSKKSVPKGQPQLRLLFWNFFCPGANGQYSLSLFPGLDHSSRRITSEPGQLGIHLYEQHPEPFKKHQLRSFHHAIREASRVLRKPVPDVPSCLLMEANCNAVKKQIDKRGMSASVIEKRLVIWLRRAIKSHPKSASLKDEDLLANLNQLIHEVDTFLIANKQACLIMARQLVKIVGGKREAITPEAWMELVDIARMVIRYLTWVLWSFPDLGIFVYVPGTSGNDSFLKMGCSIGFEVRSSMRWTTSLDAITQSVAAAESVFYFTIQEAASPYEQCRNREAKKEHIEASSHEQKPVVDFIVTNIMNQSLYKWFDVRFLDGETPNITIMPPERSARNLGALVMHQSSSKEFNQCRLIPSASMFEAAKGYLQLWMGGRGVLDDWLYTNNIEKVALSEIVTRLIDQAVHVAVLPGLRQLKLDGYEDWPAMRSEWDCRIAQRNKQIRKFIDGLSLYELRKYESIGNGIEEKIRALQTAFLRAVLAALTNALKNTIPSNKIDLIMEHMSDEILRVSVLNELNSPAVKRSKSDGTELVLRICASEFGPDCSNSVRFTSCDSKGNEAKSTATHWIARVLFPTNKKVPLWIHDNTAYANGGGIL